MRVERNHEPRDTQRRRVVRSRGNGGVGVMDRRVTICLLQAGSAEAAMIAQRERCMRGRIVRLDFKRLVQKRYRYRRIVGEMAVRKRPRTQYEIVCLQTVRTAAPCTINLRITQIRSGHDAYVLAHVLHDWTDDDAVAILRKCREAMPAEGRLLIVEAVLPDGNAPHHGKLMDLLMLTVTGGVERSQDEFAQILAQAGFRLGCVHPTTTHQSIIEAFPCDQG
jgi:hypothetical protein